MTPIAYFDLANGISGDMALAALVDAGRRSGKAVDDAIVQAVESTGLSCTVAFVEDERGGLRCLRTEVKTDGTKLQPSALRAAIARAGVVDRVRSRAERSLDALVRAEASVHGTSVDDVHLHELASADTIVDLLGAAVGLDALGVEDVVAAPVPVPRGWISSEHGPLPLPAPVVLELLAGARIRGVESEVELVTPSGAAILAGSGATFGVAPDMTLEVVGIGGGTRRTERPNICRVLIGSVEASVSLETCVLLETNIDDQTPEMIAFALETLIERGALDAWITPIVMKKSRPAFLLCVLMKPADEAVLAETLFRHTTTLGVRRRMVSRHTLDREHVEVVVHGHPIRVKVGRLRGEVVNIAPEFEDCATAARDTGLPLAEIYDAARRAV